MLYNIDRLGTGDLSARMDSTPYRETERLTTNFNHMADNIQELVEEVYQKGLLLREAEYGLLESQIHPHFIFNILQLINIRSMEIGERSICRIVTTLANLLRANIVNKNKQKITITQELEYVRYYLELQKERFGNKLQYKIQLEDDSLFQYYIPQLTIQPLVENSVVHGLENKRGGGSVVVRVWEDETCLYITVSDDGIGFNTQALHLEQASSQLASEMHNHLALLNVNRRICILYGKDYGLSIQSTPDQGTQVMITLPIDKEAV